MDSNNFKIRDMGEQSPNTSEQSPVRINLDNYIYNKCKDAFNCDEYIENNITIPINKLTIFNSLELLSEDKLQIFLNNIFSIFLEAIEILPEEKKPLHSMNNIENPEQMIVYLKHNNNWECIKMDDNLYISKKFTQLVIKPIIIECIKTWTLSLPNIKTQTDLKQYLICGVVLNKYLVIIEKSKE